MALKNKTISNPLDKLEVYVTTIMMKEKQFFDKGIVKVEKIYLKNDVEELIKDYIPKSEIDKLIEELNEDHSRIWISIFVDMLEKGYFPGKPDWDISSSSTKNIEEYCEWFTNEMTKSAESQESVYMRLRSIWKITYELKKLRDLKC